MKEEVFLTSRFQLIMMKRDKLYRPHFSTDASHFHEKLKDIVVSNLDYINCNYYYVYI